MFSGKSIQDSGQLNKPTQSDHDSRSSDSQSKARKATNKQAFLKSTGLFTQLPSSGARDDLFEMLYYNFQYPIEQVCNVHLDANRLGEYDLKEKMSASSQCASSKYFHEGSHLGPHQQYYQWQAINNGNSIKEFQQSPYDPHLKKIQQTNEGIKKKIEGEEKICLCCLNTVRKSPLSWKDCFQSIYEIQNLGPSTYLLFKTAQFLIINSLLLFAVYCLFAAATNRKASIQYLRTFINDGMNSEYSQEVSFKGLNSLSVGSKIINGTELNMVYYKLQCCVVILVVLIWMVAYIFQKKRENRFYYEQLRRDKHYTRIELFSLQFKNLPRDITEEQLENELMVWTDVQRTFPSFLSYCRQVQKSKQKQLRQHLKDKDFYSKCLQLYKASKQHYTPGSKDLVQEAWSRLINEVDKIIEEEKKLTNLRMIEKINRASLLFHENETQSPELKAQRIKSDEAKNMFVKQLKKMSENNQSMLSSQYKRLKQQYLKEKLSYSIAKKINLKQIQEHVIGEQKQKNCQPFFITFTHQKFVELILQVNKQSKFTIQHGGENRTIKIERAPEPKDIIWNNIGQSKARLGLKILISYLVAALLLGLVFLILFVISIVKRESKLFGLNTVVLITISLVVIGFNKLIRSILYALTRLERNQTHTVEQTSMAVKAVIAVVINTTLIRLIVAMYITRNLFGKGGLSEDVMAYSIINLLLQPFFKVFKLSYYLKQLWYNLRPLDKFDYTQKQYNDKMLDRSRVNYELATQYIDIVNIYLFTCFYAPLQPMILIPNITYFCVVYFAKKILLFSFCKRPTPCGNTVNEIMFYFISAGPLLFVIGHMFFSSHSSYRNPFNQLNAISLILALALLIILRIRYVTQFEVERKTQRDRAYQYYYKAQKDIAEDYYLLNPKTARMAQVQKFKKFQKNKRYIDQLQQGTKFNLVSYCVICSNLKLKKYNSQQIRSLVSRARPLEKLKCSSCGIQLNFQEQNKYCQGCNRQFCKSCLELVVRQNEQFKDITQFMKYQQYYDGKKSNKYFNQLDDINRQIKDYYLPLLLVYTSAQNQRKPGNSGQNTAGQLSKGQPLIPRSQREQPRK